MESHIDRSILGPFLSCCYINDLDQQLKHVNSFIYTDDTALLFKGKDINVINHNMSTELLNINQWFCANRFSFNIAKTNSMLFRSRHKFKDYHTLNLTQNDKMVQQVDELKYLGMILDTHLSFKQHIDKIISQTTFKEKFPNQPEWSVIWKFENLKIT